MNMFVMLDALEKVLRETQYENAYDEGCREYYFATSPRWKRANLERNKTLIGVAHISDKARRALL